jgi:predicted RNase H-like nuclease
VLGLPRKQSGIALLQRRLRTQGLGGDLARRPLSSDELDAVTIAWVGWLFSKGRGVLIGDPSEGLMLLPNAERAPRLGRGRRRRVISSPGQSGRASRPHRQGKGGRSP